MSQIAASEFGADRRCVCIEELLEGVDCGICGFAVDWWDFGVFGTLNNLIDGGGLHGGGGKKLNNN